MIKVYQESINRAKKYLKSTPDRAHDLAHTRRVVKNAIKLAKELSYQDLDFIELCCWWHDVGRTIDGKNHASHSANLLEKDLKLRCVNQPIIKKACLAVALHNWNKIPVTIEGNILRDADKLDVIELKRWRACLKANQHRYLQDIKELLPCFRAMFYFDRSREIFDDKLEIFDKSGLALQA